MDNFLNIPKQFNYFKVNKVTNDIVPFLLYEIHNKLQEDIIYIANNNYEAEHIVNILKFCLTADKNTDVIIFPESDIEIFSMNFTSMSITSKRINSLYKLVNSQKSQRKILITTVKAVMTKIMPKEIIQENILHIEKKQKISMEQIITFLIENNYNRVDLVTETGDFSVRGSLLDIYSINCDNPIRIDFFGQQIEEINIFDPVKQVTKGVLKNFTILPIKEVILRDKYIQNFCAYCNIISNKENINLDQLIDNVKSKYSHYQLEFLMSFFYKKLETIFTYLDQAIIIEGNFTKTLFQNKETEINSYIDKQLQTMEQNENILKYKNKENIYYSYAEYIDMLKNGLDATQKQRKIIEFSNFNAESSSNENINSISIKNIPNFFLESKHKNIPATELMLKNYNYNYNN